MKIVFAHHLSLSYFGGGEKWVVQVANELANRGHEVEIRCLPVMLGKERQISPRLSEKVKYEESYFHTIKDTDITYVTYHPLNWMNFRIKDGKKVAGIHSQCYWFPIRKNYGLLPNLANFVHKIVGNMELHKFDAVHTVYDAFPIDHESLYYIPNFADLEFYHPTLPKSDEFTVGFASRKIWWKGYDIYQRLKRRLTDVFFLETNNVPEQEMPNFYSKNHLSLIPSRIAPMPSRIMQTSLAVLESHMCGTPCLCYGNQPLRENSLPIYFARSISEFTKVIYGLKDVYENDYRSYQNLSTLCRKSSLEFDKKATIDKIETMFEELV